MAGIRLEWSQFGDFDTFDVIRSGTSLAAVADVDLPSPIVTGLTTMYYADTSVTHGNVYYYKIRAWRDSAAVVSGQVTVRAKYVELDLSLSPYGFWRLDETAGQYMDLSGNDNHLDASPNVLRGLPSISYAGSASSATDITKSGKYIGKFSSSDYVSYDFTVMMWLHVPSSSVSTAGEFFKLDFMNAKGFTIGISDNTTSGPWLAGRYIKIGQNGIAFRATTANFSNAEQSAHLAVRWSSGTLSVFLNGALKSTQYAGNYNTANRSVVIGAGEAGYSTTFALPLSHVAVYDGALTNSDIARAALGY